MLKSLKKIPPRAQSDDEVMPLMTDLEPTSDARLPANPAKASRRSRIVGTLQILLVLLLMAVAVYYSRAPAAPASVQGMAGMPAADAAPATNVATITPLAGKQRVIVVGNGAVGVSSNVELVTQVTGRIARMAPAMAVGGAFKAGEVLVELEQEEFLLQLRQARADVEVQIANLQLQQAKSDAAVRNYALVNPSKAVPSLVALRPQIAQAKAQLLAAESRADIAQLNLQRTRFSLPFDGMITQSSAQIGQLISSGKSFGQSYALNSVELVIPISQSDLAQIAPVKNRRVQILADGQRFDAIVDRASAELDSRSRFARLYVPLPQSAGGAALLLKPGMFADVIIEGPEHPNSLLVPESAMQAGDTLLYVRGGTLRRHQPIVLGRNPEGIVIEGFDLGEGIVIGSVSGISVGAAVKTSPVESQNR
ncbi:MAG: efflux RND transporter periplasmic adaptor subunit [Proteobacteria bacterium]|jgi:RND family efflux transporter MFP subunit|nr:efflux RND transporter periplasmic adaptor subunit [Pseudomonadota bacterium]